MTLEPATLTIKAIIETAIYVDDLQATEAFYGTVLDLKLIAKEPSRHVFFQVGESSVLLAFLAETTRRDERTPHGAKGPGHFALGIEAGDLEAWRNRLQASGYRHRRRGHMARGGKSIYFRDPSGNSVELVTPGVWGLPSGW